MPVIARFYGIDPLTLLEGDPPVRAQTLVTE